MGAAVSATCLAGVPAMRAEWFGGRGCFERGPGLMCCGRRGCGYMTTSYVGVGVSAEAFDFAAILIRIDLGMGDGSALGTDNCHDLVTHCCLGIRALMLGVAVNPLLRRRFRLIGGET